MRDFSEPVRDFLRGVRDFFSVVRDFFEGVRRFFCAEICLFKKIFVSLCYEIYKRYELILNKMYYETHRNTSKFRLNTTAMMRSAHFRTN